MGGLLSFAQEQNHVVFTVSLPEAGRSETCVDSIEELKV
jgi:hypothetical protein